MTVDCIEREGDVSKMGGVGGFESSIEAAQRWNGRDVEIQTWKYCQRTLIAQFHLKVLQGATELAHAKNRQQS